MLEYKIPGDLTFSYLTSYSLMRFIISIKTLELILYKLYGGLRA